MHRIRIWTISPNLTKVPDDKSLAEVTVSHGAAGGVLAPLGDNSDLRLRNPLEEPDFSLLRELRVIKLDKEMSE